ncbi:MAG: tetratricopeptide repeat protein, partial [bacterium]|nr:tetratricopeptide repeat protein [bacterium]
HQALGQHDQAILHYREAVEQKPDFAEAQLNLGHMLRAAGDADQAVSCFQRALEAKPELAVGYFGNA